MSHIEDPTMKSKAPTSLLKAIGEAHQAAMRSTVRLSGSAMPDDAQTPNTVVDYARDTARLNDEILADLDSSRSQSGEVYRLMAGLLNDLGLLAGSLGLPVQDLAPPLTEGSSVIARLLDAQEYGHQASGLLNTIMQTIGTESATMIAEDA